MSKWDLMAPPAYIYISNEFVTHKINYYNKIQAASPNKCSPNTLPQLTGALAIKSAIGGWQDTNHSSVAYKIKPQIC